MGNSREDWHARKRPATRPHEEFVELCAVSTAGDLTREERRELEAHLAECADCRRAIEEFEAAVDLGVPLFSSELASAPAAQADAGLASPVEVGASAAQQGKSEQRKFAFAHGDGHRTSHVNWNYVWLPFAACVVLSLALVTYTYREGKSRSSTLTATNESPNPAIEKLEQQISDAGHTQEKLRQQLAERNATIAELRREIEQESASLSEMKATQASLQATIQNDEAEKQQNADEQIGVHQKLDAAQATIQKMEVELASAREQQAAGQSADTSLQAQIVDLNRQLREREQTVNKQDDLLAHDRDIRDLMGARDLYIAEVYDVGRDGATKKPCGRVFYTKGKSLVFYAYDLDQQAGVRQAGTFQAWGRRGGDMKDATNLGIFFQDNAAKKRWVVKSDDAKTLSEIDAVFVTVEPNGGSSRPSSKPLLFAYLKIEPNHP